MAVEKFLVEASHIMMFARSVGDANQIYYDADYAKTTEPGTIIAPPTFAQSSAQFDPDYFLRPKIGEPWFGSGKEPTGIKRESSGGGGGGGGGGLMASGVSVPCTSSDASDGSTVMERAPQPTLASTAIATNERRDDMELASPSIIAHLGRVMADSGSWATRPRCHAPTHRAHPARRPPLPRLRTALELPARRHARVPVGRDSRHALRV
jgi:hypothetical protein